MPDLEDAAAEKQAGSEVGEKVAPVEGMYSLEWLDTQYEMFCGDSADYDPDIPSVEKGKAVFEWYKAQGEDADLISGYEAVLMKKWDVWTWSECQQFKDNASDAEYRRLSRLRR